jgi:molybdopterin molybdotransferase
MPTPSGDPVQSALEKFLAAFPEGPLGSEEVSLENLPGRILHDEIRAAIDSPPYSRSIIEGYLVNAPETENASDQNSVLLKIADKILPGQSHIKAVKPETAIEVNTGSYVPPMVGLAVVRQMDAQRQNDQIAIRNPVPEAANLEVQGCDIKKGTTLLKRGHQITPEDITLLAGQGILSAKVNRLPKVAIFSSGDEVIPPTQPMKPGYIWDCNSYGLSALTKTHGGIPIFKGIMKDDFDQFKENLKKALQEADMLIISGGTAVGGRDFVADLINALGSPGVVVNGVPMRGGKPLIMGVIGQKPIVCVAGHPPEAIRGFHLFGKPALSRLLGLMSATPA